MDWQEKLKEAVKRSRIKALLDHATQFDVADNMKMWSRIFDKSGTMTQEELDQAMKELEDLRNGS